MIKFLKSTKWALEGLFYIAMTERNFKIHGMIFLIVALLCIFLKPTLTQFLFIYIGHFLIMITETINTCIEKSIDLIIDNNYHKMAKRIKDMAAASVLLSCVITFIIDFMIFFLLLA